MESLKGKLEEVLQSKEELGLDKVLKSKEKLGLDKVLKSKEELKSLYPKMSAIVIGTGPSFLLNYRSEVFQWPTHWQFYGCSYISGMIKNLTAYCYADSDHRAMIPDPSDEFHIGCRCYASSPRLLTDKPWLLPFYTLDIPHGCFSGTMALSLACFEHNHVGLIGFDGNSNDFQSDTKHSHYYRNARYVINYWQNRGRHIISLMENSIFNEALLDNISSADYSDDAWKPIE